MVPDASRFLKLHKRSVGKNANHGPMGDSRPMAFLGCARGHSVEYGDSGSEAHRAYQFNRYSPSNPSVSGNRWPRASYETWDGSSGAGDAQATCSFSCSGSNASPFFQRVDVMAAILRASVKRAISGFIPLASRVS